MRLGEAFPSKWLSAADIPDGGMIVTIESYDMETIGQGEKKQTKPVLYFVEDVKPMVLNKTNGGVTAQILGSDDLDDWVGQQITLVSREVEFQGDLIDAVRVQVPKRKPAPKPAPATKPTGQKQAAKPAPRPANQPPPEGPPLDDEVDADSIPF
jgi:hypothetical protein